MTSVETELRGKRAELSEVNAQLLAKEGEFTALASSAASKAAELRDKNAQLDVTKEQVGQRQGGGTEASRAEVWRVPSGPGPVARYERSAGGRPGG